MAQLDDVVGSVMQKVKDLGIDNDTIIIAFTTDNGTENHLARWWADPIRRRQGHRAGRRLPRSHAAALARKVPAGRDREPDRVGLDWFPTAGVGGRNQTSSRSSRRAKRSAGAPTRSISTDTTRPTCSPAGKSKRSEIFYFAGSTLGAVRINDFKYRFIDQPNGWLGATVSRLADPGQSAARSLRAHGHRRIAGVLQLVRLRVLALRLLNVNRKSPLTPRPSSTSRRCRRGELQPGSFEANSRRRCRVTAQWQAKPTAPFIVFEETARPCATKGANISLFVPSCREPPGQEAIGPRGAGHDEQSHD